MRRIDSKRWAGLLGALMISGCSAEDSGAAPGPVPEPSQGDEVAETTVVDSSPTAAQTSGPVTERLYLAPRESAQWTRVFRVRPTAAPSGSMGDARAVFRQVAPATVIVRPTDGGHGTGVLLAGGMVLTNHHVVEPAPMVEFLRRVQIQFGSVSANGTVTALPAVSGTVVTSSAALDLALIKLDAPAPAGVVPVELSMDPPLPGEPVVAFGHGSAGLVWGVRSCEVQGVGRLAESWASLASVCAQSADPRVEEMCHEMRNRAEHMASMFVVQTSCMLSSGDSGGPLVNDEGKLVALNSFLLRAPSGAGTGFFHVHLDEIRRFVESAPTDPRPDVPRVLGLPGDVIPLDQDADGRFDTLRIEPSPDQAALLFDLDSDTADFPVGAARDVYRAGFDAEVGILRGAEGEVVFYDRDSDGAFDTLLVAGREVEAAYTLDAEGMPQAAPELVEPRATRLRPSWLSEHARRGFERLVGREPTDLIGPLPAALRRGQLMDRDQDGRNDVLAARAGLQVFALDPNQDILPTLTASGVEAAVRAGLRGVEVSIVFDGDTRRLWAWYDADQDGRLETVLFGDSKIVDHAVVVDADGSSREAAGFVGTQLGHPELASDPRAERLLRAVGVGVGVRELGGVPEPFAVHFEPAVEPIEVRGWDHALARVSSDAGETVLFDLDRDTFPARSRAEADVAQAVEEGRFDAEVAVVMIGKHQWCYYDSDDDGQWDRVHAFVVPLVGEGRLVGWARGADGASPLAPAALVDPSVFRDRALRTALQRIGRELFVDGVMP